MANGNNITLVGNVTRDPELRFTPSGQATATFGLAVNRVWTDRQTNERREAVSFFDVVCWREMAENASQSLPKGARVIVTGRLEQRSWETNDGGKRSNKDLGRRAKKRVCIFCKDHIDWVDYKDVNLLRRFISDRGKIRARRVSGNCAQHQREVAVAIKTARELALLPYAQRTMTERGGGRRPPREAPMRELE